MALYDPITPILQLGLWIVGGIVFVVGLVIATRPRRADDAETERARSEARLHELATRAASRRSDEEPPVD
jgi:cytochrome c-type biogenesis protein CcmH/NrfF